MKRYCDVCKKAHDFPEVDYYSMFWNVLLLSGYATAYANAATPVLLALDSQAETDTLNSCLTQKQTGV